jgi:hypothetical protein
MSTMTIPSRYNGPPGSGNGGVSAGLFAAAFREMNGPNGPVQVTLRQPPPLGTPLELTRVGTGLQVMDADTLVATVEPTEAELRPVAPVAFIAATQASVRYDGRTDHPFPSCFVCGTGREANDGLSVFAGALDPGNPRRVAAPFVPGETGLDDLPLVWAALDCPGGWSTGLIGRRAVLGRMSADVHGTPARGERCVVVAECDGSEGRKAFSRASLYGADGRLLGVAAQTWIELR